jgi:carbamoyl-phosphate synthase large subunit
MPRRDDLHTILVLGSGPIVIGQAGEFDYSGTQACRVLREEGLRVVLVNSNPATIMTDPDVADATYIEPLTVTSVRAVIDAERPDALLATLGGQTALNLAIELSEAGVLEEFGVELLGADVEAIRTAEDRERFRRAMEEVGLETPRSVYVRTVDEAVAAAADLGYPLVLRPSFTLGGKGGGIAHDEADLRGRISRGIADSPVGEVLVEESVLGWKEFELEVMRDRNDNCVIVCSIENLDAMGVHTGDSITVAPAMTLSDPELQTMRDAAFTVLRRIGVETGGSNVQFAVDPVTGRQLVIEMNPRVSRSSALASKATGFPIAKIAARLALGYTLDEIANDITGRTRAAFEPAIDYVVVKVPRFDFEKFPGADDTLTTRMHSVGEAMAFGRSFRDALQRALRSLEDGTVGFHLEDDGCDDATLRADLVRPTPRRILRVAQAIARGMHPDEVAALTAYDPWFVDQMARLTDLHARVAAAGPALLTEDDPLLREAKRDGVGDRLIGALIGADEGEVRAARHRRGVRPVYRTVDTCAAEFDSSTPYHYATYDEDDEVAPHDRPAVVVLGSGPNRIGQGVEFDYCCVHAVLALKEAGYETIMINCNPETVSTDYDTADRLYFEPLSLEDVLEVVDRERPVGVIVQFGGQTPLKLARGLADAGVPIWGTSPDAIATAEDRGLFAAMMDDIGARMPAGSTARTPEEAREVAGRIGYPVLVRPSFVLGGRAMRIVDDPSALDREVGAALAAAGDQTILVDRFLESAVEVDVDVVFDGEELLVGGILEHIEEAGVHSGDSACAIPPVSLSRALEREVVEVAGRIARGLGVIGLMNVQFAVRDQQLFCIEANPRASRTVPFVSKAVGVPLAKVAARVMAGTSLAALRVEGVLPVHGYDPDLLEHVAVKEAVLPFDRFPGVDPALTPEMRSTGEVMGIADDFGDAFARAQGGTGTLTLPTSGTVFLSVADRDKRAVVLVARRLVDLGLGLLATDGTARVLERWGVPVTRIGKVTEGDDAIVRGLRDGGIDLVFNTPYGPDARGDGVLIRQTAVSHGVPCVTTLAGMSAALLGVEALQRPGFSVRSLQSRHAAVLARVAARVPVTDRAG